jgi:hypothetical protein
MSYSTTPAHISFGLVISKKLLGEDKDGEGFLTELIKHLRTIDGVLQVMDSSCEVDDKPSKYEICASSMGHVVPISSPMLSRKQLIRALTIAFDYIEKMEKGVSAAAEAKKHYHGLVGARR